jgi:sugar phosphate permease
MEDTGIAPATLRKIVLRILPLLFICYVVAMIDRLNVGFAKLQFIGDLGLTEASFGAAAGLLYLGYILFEVPSNLMLHRAGARRTLLRIMVLWGVFTILQAWASGKYGFYALRFLIGAAEAGFFPGVLLYLTYWFPDRLRGRVTSLFVMALPAAGIVGGPLAAWIMTGLDGHAGLRGWQWLFILEGIPAIALGVVCYLFLADRPEQARWLDGDEQRAVARAVQAGASGKGAAAGAGQVQLRDALRDPVLYKLAFCYFAFYCVENALLVWIPTLLKNVGVATIAGVGWVSSGIALAATAIMLAVGYSSDKRGERRRHVIGCGLAAGATFLLLPLAAHSVALTALILTLSSGAVFAFLAVFWTIPSALFKGRAAAGGLALISSIGALGGTFSPIFIGWIKEATGSYYYSLGTLGAVLILSLFVLDTCFPRTRREDAAEASRAT